jgi:hypothetical protein
LPKRGEVWLTNVDADALAACPTPGKIRLADAADAAAIAKCITRNAVHEGLAPGREL